MTEESAASDFSAEHTRATYFKIAVQSGFPDEVLPSIYQDEWASRLCREPNGTLYVEQILLHWTGEPISLQQSYDPHHPEYHRYHSYFVGQDIAECGVDIAKVGPGKYLLTTDRGNTRLVRKPLARNDQEADAESLAFVGRHIPVVLQRYAGIVHEHYEIGELHMTLEGLCTREISVMPGGHLDAVLHHQATHKPIPKGGPELIDDALQAMRQMPVAMMPVVPLKDTKRRHKRRNAQTV